MYRTERARVWTPEEREARSVALDQPHRRGSDSPMSGFALGRFCLRHWADEGTQRDYCDIGERYARLIDVERLDRGERARQNAELDTYPEPRTVAEQMERRERSAAAVREAEDAIRQVDLSTVRILRSLAYDDHDLPAWQEGRAYAGLYKLKIHFEGLDKKR